MTEKNEVDPREIICSECGMRCPEEERPLCTILIEKGQVTQEEYEVTKDHLMSPIKSA